VDDAPEAVIRTSVVKCNLDSICNDSALRHAIELVVQQTTRVAKLASELALLVVLQRIESGRDLWPLDNIFYSTVLKVRFKGGGGEWVKHVGHYMKWCTSSSITFNRIHILLLKPKHGCCCGSKPLESTCTPTMWSMLRCW
jgi:hypothetical protein